jgi:hypothetical protein
MGEEFSPQWAVATCSEIESFRYNSQYNTMYPLIDIAYKIYDHTLMLNVLLPWLNFNAVGQLKKLNIVQDHKESSHQPDLFFGEVYYVLVAYKSR